MRYPRYQYGIIGILQVEGDLQNPKNTPKDHENTFKLKGMLETASVSPQKRFPPGSAVFRQEAARSPGVQRGPHRQQRPADLGVAFARRVVQRGVAEAVRRGAEKTC